MISPRNSKRLPRVSRKFDTQDSGGMGSCREDTNGSDYRYHPVYVGTGASSLSPSRAEGPTFPPEQPGPYGAEDPAQRQDPFVDERSRLKPLKRQEALSDLWQSHRAFRANQHSMKGMFQEVSREDSTTEERLRDERTFIGQGERVRPTFS